MKSSADKGTLYQLRNLINRTSVPTSPEKNMNSAEDFMLLALHAHIVSAAKVIQDLHPTQSVTELAHLIVTNFMRLPKVDDAEDLSTSKDGVHLYATELLTLGLIWHGYHDAIKEGDGERMLRYWKFLLVLFKSTNHHNYAKEAVNILHQYYYLLTERQKMQLLWNRCVNTRGIIGQNIPCDLHMEHLNRRLKGIIRSMGANVNPAAIEKAGRLLSPVHNVCLQFEQVTAQQTNSGLHKVTGFGKDFQSILSVLEEEQVFIPTQVRQHSRFQFTCGIMEKLTHKELLKKVETSLKKL